MKRKLLVVLGILLGLFTPLWASIVPVDLLVLHRQSDGLGAIRVRVRMTGREGQPLRVSDALWVGLGDPSDVFELRGLWGRNGTLEAVFNVPEERADLLALLGIGANLPVDLIHGQYVVGRLHTQVTQAVGPETDLFFRVDGLRENLDYHRVVLHTVVGGELYVGRGRHWRIQETPLAGGRLRLTEPSQAQVIQAVETVGIVVPHRHDVVDAAPSSGNHNHTAHVAHHGRSLEDDYPVVMGFAAGVFWSE